MFGYMTIRALLLLALQVRCLALLVVGLTDHDLYRTFGGGAKSKSKSNKGGVKRAQKRYETVYSYRCPLPFALKAAVFSSDRYLIRSRERS